MSAFVHLFCLVVGYSPRLVDLMTNFGSRHRILMTVFQRGHEYFVAIPRSLFYGFSNFKLYNHL